MLIVLIQKVSWFAAVVEKNLVSPYKFISPPLTLLTISNGQSLNNVRDTVHGNVKVASLGRAKNL